MEQRAESTSPAGGSTRGTLEVFAYLQLLDVLSTWIGFSLGNGEASPFIRLMIAWGPAAALLASKAIAFGLVVLCLILKKGHLVRLINYWFAALVVWNLYTAIRVVSS